MYDDDEDGDDHKSRPRGTSQALAMLNAKLPTRFVKFRNERYTNVTEKKTTAELEDWKIFYLVVRDEYKHVYLWTDLN